MSKAIGKTFWIDRDVSQRFKVKCAEKEVTQQGVIEILMIKWLKDGKGKN